MSDSEITVPFKGLAPFEVDDAPIFFGRESERKLVVANLLGARLTLLYGPTGVGKTSLLDAGVGHDLRTLADNDLQFTDRRNFAVTTFRDWRSPKPEQAIIEAAMQALEVSPEKVPDVLNLALDEAFAVLTSAADMRLLVILDQFEEHFLYEPDSDRCVFDYQFPLAVACSNLRVNFLVSLREDALASLDRYTGSIPSLFDNYMRIDRLDDSAARSAIFEPVRWYNEQQALEQPGANPVEVESALVEQIIRDVRGGLDLGDIGLGGTADDARIEAPYLQLVLLRLWDTELASGSTRLRLETFEALGGAADIVRSHLDRAMEGLTEPEQDIAAAISRYLVTPSGAKVAYSVSDLADYANTAANLTSGVLARLADSEMRILRTVPPVPPNHDVRFELYHDVLAEGLADWRKRHELERAESRVVVTQQAKARSWTLFAVGFTSASTATVAAISTAGTFSSKVTPFAVAIFLVVLGALFAYLRPILDAISSFGARRREHHERAALRRAHGLRVVRGPEADASPEQLPDGVFGFEEIFAVDGLKDGRARLKPDHEAPDGHPYPLEVQKRVGEVFLVGYVSADDANDIATPDRHHVKLWMRRNRDAPVLVAISLPTIEASQSLGDGSPENGFRIFASIANETSR